MAKKKIGIIGSGIVAQTLGNGFLNHGYEVMLGTRDVTRLTEWKSRENSQANIGSVEECVRFGGVIILAVKGSAAETIVREQADGLAGKTIIDTTNPIADAAPVNGVLKFTTDLNDSLLEKLQRAVPAANFVKAFNCVGAQRMVNPQFSEGKPSMFTCGNSDGAKREAHDILKLFGWDIADMGKAEAARAIEPLAMLWCISGFTQNEWTHAFKVLHH